MGSVGSCGRAQPVLHQTTPRGDPNGPQWQKRYIRVSEARRRSDIREDVAPGLVHGYGLQPDGVEFAQKTGTTSRTDFVPGDARTALS